MENEITAHKAGTIERAADHRGRLGHDRRHARRHHVVSDVPPDDARRPAARGRRLAADPVDLGGRAQPRGTRGRRDLGPAARAGRRRHRELVPTAGGAPLVVGELRASRDDAPTILIYGHYDVQDVGDERCGSSPPFEPDGARRPHLRARRLRRQGQLPAAAARRPARWRDAGELPRPRARAGRRRGGDRRRRRRSLGRGRRARRRRGDRLRRGHGRRGHAGADDRRARDHAARDLDVRTASATSTRACTAAPR